ncbi:hypothetical protein C8R43DRAFT_944913 [Mycena crocata]|nr:hypothetical protein C8R43DRAFT_944913 [Mycena crocata]
MDDDSSRSSREASPNPSELDGANTPKPHSVKPKEVRRRMLASASFKTTRKVSLYNAKISRIMAGLNAGRELGQRYKIPQVKRMVADDPSMLEGFTEEEEAEMVEEVLEKRKTKRHGARATNKAAKEDARRTIDHLALEIMALAERCGFVFFTRGHTHDRTVPVTIESWGAMQFVCEMLRKEPSDVQAMFELWAVSRQRGNFGGETLKELQKACTLVITTGYQNIINVPNAAMNYDGYIKSIVEKKGFGLVGWPKETEFKRMSLQSAIGPLHALHKALVTDRTCYWKKLTPSEKERILAQFDEMVESGEVVEKVRKVKGRSASKKSKPAVEEDEEEEEQEDEEESQPQKPVASMTTQERRARLTKLARTTSKGRRERSEGNDNEEEAPRKLTKCKSAGNDDETERRRLKKEVRCADEGGEKSSAAENRKGKRKGMEREEDGEEDGAPRKRSKRKAADDDNAVARKTSKHKTGTAKKTPGTKVSKLPRVGVQPAQSPSTVQPPRNSTQSRPKPTPAWNGAPGAAKTSIEASGSGSAATPPSPPRAASPSHIPSPPHSTPPSRPASPPARSESPPASAAAPAGAIAKARRNVVKGPRGGPLGKRAGASGSE